MIHTPTPNPAVYAALARMTAREDAARSHASGEPCRCPESALDCACGAYTYKTEVA